MQAVEAAAPASKTLMLLAGIWFAVATMIFVVILYQVSRIGFERLRMAEIITVLIVTAFLMALHIISGRISYRLARLFEGTQGETTNT